VASDIFTTDDDALYAAWEKEKGAIVSLYIPGVCVVRMTLEKAEEISKELARQIEYGRWYEIEERHNANPSKI
jgi:tRNA(Ser,Leu) C12 N-acetylase TAN1